LKPEKQSILIVVLFAIYLLLLVAVILFKLPFFSPGGADERVINLIPLMGSFDEHGVLVPQEIVYNIALFVPLGVYICMIKSDWSYRKKIIPIIGLTVAFEVAQFIFALGRSDITDCLSNTLGGIIGIILYALLTRIFKDRTAKIITALAVCATIYVVARFVQLFYLSHFVMLPLSP
jgi:glycopeptide antibiotics resistance protein